jgi:hypothetical protein
MPQLRGNEPKLGLNNHLKGKKRRMMHWLSRPFLVDSQVLSKRAWDNALPPRIYG